MNPHDWLFLQNCAERFGDVLALFQPPLENSTLASQIQSDIRINDEVLAPLLKISEHIFLIDSNFEDKSFNGAGREIRECVRSVANDLAFIPAGDFIFRFREFWIGKARSHIARGKVLLFIVGNSEQVKEVFRKAVVFAFVPSLPAEVGKSRLNSVHDWLVEAPHRIVVYTRTSNSLVFMTTPTYMHELMEDYELSHSNLNKPGSTLKELDEVPSRVEQFISRHAGRVFSTQAKRVKSALFEWIKGRSNEQWAEAGGVREDLIRP